MPFEKLAFSLDPDSPLAFEGVERVRYMQWVMTAAAIWTGAIALAGLVAAAVRDRLAPLFAIATIAALAAHGCLLLTALLASGFSRFTQGVWPAIVTAAVFGLWAALPARLTAR